MRREGYGIPGLNDGRIRDIQEEAAAKTAARREGIDKILAEKKRQKEFYEGTIRDGMSKGDLRRTSMAKK